MLAVERQKGQPEIRCTLLGVGAMVSRKEQPEAGISPDETSASKSKNLHRM